MMQINKRAQTKQKQNKRKRKHRKRRKNITGKTQKNIVKTFINQHSIL